MSDYVTLTGEVVFNHITTPDNYLGVNSYKLTVALDKDGLKEAEKQGLALKEYNGLKQITSKRKVDFGEPQVYNADKELVGSNHLSLFGDKVKHLTMHTHTSKRYEWMRKQRVQQTTTHLSFKK